MIKLIGIVMFTIVCLSAYAQDSLRYDKINKAVYQNNARLDRVALVETIRPNEAAFKHLSASTDSNVGANILGSIGGFGLGFTAGYFLFRQEIPWIALGVGAGCLTGAVLLHFRSKSQLRKSLDVYNSDLGLSSIVKRPFEFDLSLNQNGLGLNFRF